MGDGGERERSMHEGESLAKGCARVCPFRKLIKRSFPLPVKYDFRCQVDRTFLCCISRKSPVTVSTHRAFHRAFVFS